MITGTLSISNGMYLGYPIPPVVLSLLGLADKVLVGVDPTYPADRRCIEMMGLPNVECVDSVWNRTIDMGREIAAQMDLLVERAEKMGATWVVVAQADELFHQDDFSMLRRFMGSPQYEDAVGFSTERLYFWGALNKVRQDWNARLIRIFRPGYFSFLAEGTDKAGMYSGQIKPGRVVDLTYKIYHYSRLGSPEEISKRVRNLDQFFHPEEELVPLDQLPEYDFKGREYDNYSIVSPPPEKEMNIVEYNETHPIGVEEWFDI